MIPFRADAFVSISRLWQHGSGMQEAFEIHPWIARLVNQRSSKRNPEKTLDSFLRREVEIIRNIREDVSNMGFASSVDQIDRILSSFDRGQLNYKRYVEMQRQLHDRMEDEFRHGQFFMVLPHKFTYYSEAATKFGEDVNRAFPSAQSDIEHAAKCYAFGRSTATVFHLMRVMEIGLRALGNSLKDPTLDPKNNPNWGTILRRCDEELKLPSPKRSLDWAAHEQFYCDATANLRAVKDAWRNRTMHVERDYDEDESLDVFNAVRGFMRQLATKLHE
jgi:hypothetical protein